MSEELTADHEYGKFLPVEPRPKGEDAPPPMRVFNDFPHALPVIEAVMERGARTHADEDWRAMPSNFHLARGHLDLLAVGDTSEPHLAHAACRLSMELERDVFDPRRVPSEVAMIVVPTLDQIAHDPMRSRELPPCAVLPFF